MSFDKRIENQYQAQLEKEFRNHRSVFAETVLKPGSIEGTFDPEIAERLVSRMTSQILVWRERESTIFMVNYIIKGGCLMVSGDLGEIIYEWSSPISWGFLVNTSFDYFASKARGIDGYDKPFTWTEDRVMERVAEYRDDHKEDEDWEDPFDGFESHLESEEAWIAFLEDSSVDTSDLEAWSWGRGPNFRCYAHWYGIKMAIRQLKGG